MQLFINQLYFIMKNKAKLAFELLEQEMEVIYKEELIQFIGGSGGYTWQQLVNDINNGNFNSVPTGSYDISSDGSVTIYGGMLQEVVIRRNSSSGGYSSNGYSSGGYSSGGYNWVGFNSYLNDSYFMNSQFWAGSGYSGGGSGYSVSSTYVAGSGNNSSGGYTGYTPMQIIDVLNSAGGITTNWTSAASDILKLETSMFRVASTSFGVLDVVLNAEEMRNQGFNWTDAGQIALGGALLIPGLNATVVIAGGIILLSWEMYEANNP